VKIAFILIYNKQTFNFYQLFIGLIVVLPLKYHEVAISAPDVVFYYRSKASILYRLFRD